MEITSINQLIQYFQLNFPEYAKEMQSCTHHYDEQNLNVYHLEGDIWTHTNMVLMQVRDMNVPTHRFKVAAISALLHDIGKPAAAEYKHETKRKRFIGHEGLSTVIAIEVLEKMANDGIVSNEEAIEILKVVNLHSALFDVVKEGADQSKLISKFRYQKELFKYVQIQSEADSNGRYYDEEVVNTPGHHKEMPQEVFNEIYDCIAPEREQAPTIGNPTCTLLIGAPLSGKSTFLQNATVGAVIVSRDDILVGYGLQNNLGATYSEIWHNLSDADQKNIDVMTQTKFQTAVKSGMNIVIDMTNMSMKSRNRWIGNLPRNYVKKAVVVLTSYKELLARNEIRANETGKNIPEYVIKNMAKSFAMPMYNEFDTIEYLFNGVRVKGE